MGKMKNLVIDQMNDEGPASDSAGYTEKDREIDNYYQNEYGQNQLDPPPDMIDTDSGKSMWIIKDYKIWAETYQQALELLPLIESI